MEIRSILENQEKAVVIAHYRLDSTGTLYNGGGPPQNPACLLQITLDSSKLSPSQKLIRLGNTAGDEIIGWTKLDALEIVEILGTLGKDNKTVTPVTWPPPWSLEAQKDAA